MVGKTAIILVLLSVLSLNMVTEKSGEYVLVQIGKVNVFHDTLAKVLHYESGLMIDADGSPFAYHPVSDSGRDALANAGRKGNWWGIVTDASGKPIVQSKSDPAPGYYVSTTSLQNNSIGVNSPYRYINSDSVPFFVLPANKTILNSVHLGDIALVENTRIGKGFYAIFADVGPKDKIGEGSIYLANQLGIASNPRTGGIEDSIRYTIYLGSGDGLPKTRLQIDSIGASCSARVEEKKR